MYQRLKVGDVHGVAERSSGPRAKGGVYLDVAGDPDGKPIEFFVMDPPTPLPIEAAIKAQVRAVQRLGPNYPIRRVSVVPDPADPATAHVVDWVDQKRYLNVADLIEEGRRFGFSRRCELAEDEFELLSDKSLLILVHSKGHIANWQEYGPLLHPCPKTTVGSGQIPDDHASWGPQATVPGTMCAGYWWNDVEGGVAVAPGLAGGKALTRAVNRFMPTNSNDPWSYGTAYTAPPDVTPKYVPAMVARLPIGGFSVVTDDLPLYRDRIGAARASGYPVREVPA